MSATKDLNLFFPLYDLSPQGWLNDFISSQLPRDKDGIAYSMLYRNYDYCKDETKTAIRTALEKQSSDLFLTYKERNKVPDDFKFFYINGRYADKLENNILVKTGNEVSLKKYLLTMNNIKPFQLAFFQPYMKLYYGWKEPGKNQKDYTWIEFPFTQKFDLDTILNPLDNSFLEGSGIKSINNSQQFNVGIKVNAEISISYFFSNMGVLTREINNTGYEMPYGFSFQKVFAFLGIENESLKLEYGYQIDPTLYNDHKIDPGICDLINRREKREFLLLKSGHNFSFTKEGNVEITVNYKNRFEGEKYKENNILLPSKQNPSNITIFTRDDVTEAASLIETIEKLHDEEKEISEKIKLITLKSDQEGIPVGKNSEQAVQSMKKQKEKNIETLKNKLKEVSSSLTLAKRQALPYFKDVLIEKIRDNLNLYSISFNTTKDKKNKIYKISSKLNLLTTQNKELFLTDLTQQTYTLDDFLRNTSPNLKDANAKMETTLNRIFNTPSGTTNTNKEFGHIVFFPVKALIKAVYEMLSPKEQKKVPSFLIGNLSARVFNDLYYINAGHVLIEVKTFQKWLYEKFYSRNNISFSLGEFMDQIIEDLVPQALYRERTYPQQNTRLTIQDYTFCSIKDDNSFNYLNNMRETLEHFEVNNESIQQLVGLLDRYKTDGKPLVVYSKLDIPSIQEITSCSFNVNTTNDLNLNEDQDAEHGIPHLVIGSDGGMFLSADFSQIDLKGLRTGIALQALTDQNSSNFFYQYNLTAQVIGSSLFNHGSFICIPRPPLGFEGAKHDIGIVGYYKVKDLKDSLTPGSYKSTVSADWFWNPRQGKDGTLENSNVNVAKSPTEIKDFINKETLTPLSYVKYLLEKDAISISNIDAKKKSEPGKSKEKEAKKEPKVTKKSKNEGKEK